ncbi:MAG: hypothetical protein M0T71_04000 [Actinomycetota bacterium]|nr:hypothetical protein [Actinomycetota bacterium]
MATQPGELGEPAGTAGEERAGGAARRPFELGRARRAAIDTLAAYRAARDPGALAGVFQALADDLPAHWLVAGLLSVSSQLVDYLSASEKLDADEVLAALASLEVEDQLADLTSGREDDEADGAASEAPDRPDRPGTAGGPAGEPAGGSSGERPLSG